MANERMQFLLREGATNGRAGESRDELRPPHASLPKGSNWVAHATAVSPLVRFALRRPLPSARSALALGSNDHEALAGHLGRRLETQVIGGLLGEGFVVALCQAGGLGTSVSLCGWR